MANDDTIGTWTTTDLIRFLQAILRDDETIRNLSLGSDSFKVRDRLTLDNELMFGQAGTTSVGAAGAASAPPASPELYIKVIGPDNTVRLIPLYKTG